MGIFILRIFCFFFVKVRECNQRKIEKIISFDFSRECVKNLIGQGKAVTSFSGFEMRR